MSEVCPECHGEGERYYELFGDWSWCRNCGGEGRIDPYQEDEWYDESESYCEDHPDACYDAAPPSPTLLEADHDNG